MVLANVLAWASMSMLFHAMRPLPFIGDGLLQVRLLDGSGLSSSTTLTSEHAIVHAAQIATTEPHSPTDIRRSNSQGIQDYLPVSALSERPELLIDIDPEWYLQGLDLPSLSALLLINEYGDVDDLVIDTPFLTPMLLEDLKTRFRSARFLPGRLHGRAVKVALRVAIQLD